MKQPSVTVARYLAQRLSEVGVGHLFAVPGDYVTPFLDVLEPNGSPPPLARVAAVNELEAGYAADGYARYRGVGAFAVTYGVGAFSAVNAVAGSYVERLPVVVINGSPSHANRRIERGQRVLFHHSTGDLDSNLNVFRHVTVAAEVLRAGVEAPEQIDRCLRAALLHSRPVYIEGMKDIWQAACPGPAGPLGLDAPPTEPAQLEEAVSAAGAVLRGAERGVIWAGVEVQRFRLQNLLQELIEASGWPYTTTLLAKTVLPEDHPLFAGVYTGPAAPENTRAEVEEADAILALGTVITDDYLDIVATSYEQMIVAVDGQVRVGSRVFSPVALKDFLAALRDERPKVFLHPRTPERARGRARRRSRALTFETFFERMKTFLTDKMVAVADESDCLYVASAVTIPRRDSFVAQGIWGSIGYALPAAVGVGLGSGRRPVVFIGDGGFQMTCQALSTLYRADVGAIVFVMANGIYGIEQALVDRRPFPESENYDPTIGFKPYNTLPPWNYVDLAKAIVDDPTQFWGAAVSTPAELESALGQIKPKRKLSLIQVNLDPLHLPAAIDRLAADTGYPKCKP